MNKQWANTVELAIRQNPTNLQKYKIIALTSKAQDEMQVKYKCIVTFLLELGRITTSLFVIGFIN